MQAHDLAFAEDQFLTFKGQRAFAMMHLAMHDALNAIVPVYSGYAFRPRAPTAAHPIAAPPRPRTMSLAQYPDAAGNARRPACGLACAGA